MTFKFSFHDKILIFLLFFKASDIIPVPPPPTFELIPTQSARYSHLFLNWFVTRNATENVKNQAIKIEDDIWSTASPLQLTA